MSDREALTTAVRQAIWNAHERRCAYTSEPVDWSELEIDHIIAVRGDDERKSELGAKGIIAPDFDINGFENLLPTKRHRNNQKSNYIHNDASVVFFLGLADQRKEKAKRLYNSFTVSDNSLKGYLQLKAQADRNDIDVEELLSFVQHQVDGEVPMKISPEVDGAPIARANSEFATVLMDKPFALGGGSINEVRLCGEEDNFVICTTANQFLEAKASGYYPLTQYDITSFGLADQTSELLRAVRDSSYAPISELRSPMITLNSLNRWASAWAQDCFIDFEPAPDFSKLKTLNSLIREGLLRVEQQSAWSLTLIPSSGGLAVQISELMRADLDGDTQEEILIFHLTFATEGTLRAGVTRRAKMMADGLLFPVDLRSGAVGLRALPPRGG